MHPAVQRAVIKVGFFHQWTYERTDGRLGSSPLGRPMLLLRTVGCNTGTPRTSALLYVTSGERYAVIASNGGARRNPGWFHNLMAAPDAEIQIGRTRIPVRARIADDMERTQTFAEADKMLRNLYSGYQKRSDRRIPVLVLEPREVRPVT